MSCSKILFIYDPGSKSEPDHLPPPLLSLMPSMNLWWSAFFVTLVNSYSDSDIIAPKPKWFWVTINFFLNFLFIFFSLWKPSKRKDNETCVRFAVWWSDSDQTAALKVKLNVLNRTQLHHSRVSLAGCLLLRLWAGSSSCRFSPISRRRAGISRADISWISRGCARISLQLAVQCSFASNSALCSSWVHQQCCL